MLDFFLFLFFTEKTLHNAKNVSFFLFARFTHLIVIVREPSSSGQTNNYNSHGIVGGDDQIAFSHK